VDGNEAAKPRHRKVQPVKKGINEPYRVPRTDIVIRLPPPKAAAASGRDEWCSPPDETVGNLYSMRSAARENGGILRLQDAA